MLTTACTERVSRLQHYSHLFTAEITMQKLCTFTVSITGLPRSHSDGVDYYDIKEHHYIIPKIAILVFMLNVLNYITGSGAVCKVYLK